MGKTADRPVTVRTLRDNLCHRSSTQRATRNLLPELLLLGELLPPEAIDTERDWEATADVFDEFRERAS